MTTQRSGLGGWARAAAALAFLLAFQAACKKREAAPPPAPPKPAPAKPGAGAPGVAASSAAVQVSTPAAPRAPTPEDYYKASRLRDPFVSLQGGAAAAPAAKAPEAFSAEPGGEDVEVSSFDIHNLDLKGILKDGTGRMALLVDRGTKASYILKGSRVLGAKNEPVPDVIGKIIGQSVRLITLPDHDVQELRLGEKDDEDQ